MKNQKPLGVNQTRGKDGVCQAGNKGIASPESRVIPAVGWRCIQAVVSIDRPPGRSSTPIFPWVLQPHARTLLAPRLPNLAGQGTRHTADMDTRLDRGTVPVMTLKPAAAAGVATRREVVEFNQVGGAVQLHAEPALRVVVGHHPVGPARRTTLLLSGRRHGGEARGSPPRVASGERRKITVEQARRFHRRMGSGRTAPIRAFPTKTENPTPVSRGGVSG